MGKSGNRGEDPALAKGHAFWSLVPAAPVRANIDGRGDQWYNHVVNPRTSRRFVVLVQVGKRVEG